MANSQQLNFSPKQTLPRRRVCRKLHDGFRWTLPLQQIEGRLTYKQLTLRKNWTNRKSYRFWFM